MVQFNFNDMNSYGGRGKFGGKPQVTAPSKLSVDELKVIVLTYKIEAICVVVFLLGILVLWMFMGGQMAKISTLNSEVQLLTDKELSVSNYIKSKQDDQLMLTSIPPVLESDKRVISYLTSLAIKRNIKITSMSPPDEKNLGFFFSKTIKLTCSADAFQNALMFVNDIEQSKYSLKVDSWDIRQGIDSPVDSRMRRLRAANSDKVQEGKDSKLTISMSVSLIELVDNEKK